MVIRELSVSNWEFSLFCGYPDRVFGTVFFPNSVVVDSVVVLDCEFQGDGPGHNGEAFAMNMHRFTGPPLHWLPEGSCVTTDPAGFVGHRDLNLGGIGDELVGSYEISLVHASARDCAQPWPPGDNDLSFDTVMFYYHEVDE